MNTKIIIASQTSNNDWCNIKTPEGKEISLNLKSNPITAKLIQDGAKEVEVNLVDKNGKFYAWDIKEQKSGGFAKLTSEQLAEKKQREDHTQRMIVAQNCMSNATNFYSQSTGKTFVDIAAMAKDMYAWVMTISKDE